jgi:hypothetical protein
MVEQDEERFRAFMTIMGESLGDPMNEAKFQGYWLILSAFTIDEVEMAGHHMMREWGSNRMPSPGMFVREISRQAEQRVREMAVLPPVRGDAIPWMPECETCGDDGWKNIWCPGESAQHDPKPHLERSIAQCGRAEHPDKSGHEYVVPCPCRPHNTKYQRSRAALAAAAPKGKGKGKGRSDGDEVYG